MKMQWAEVPPAPLLEIQLELVAPDIVWKPEVGEGSEKKVGRIWLCQCW